MGWDTEAGMSLNVSAFFGGGAERLVFGKASGQRQEAGGDQNEMAPPRRLPASSHGPRELLNMLRQLNQS